MPFDFKKVEKQFYSTKQKPVVIDIPEMTFISIQGSGDPNEEGGMYQSAVQKLYSIAYTIRMSPRNNKEIEDFFTFVVPPLEGYWWQDGVKGVDPTRKQDFQWIMQIRMPEFVTEDVFEWAKEEALSKKKIDCSDVEFTSYAEGLVVQMMHLGPYDEEIETVKVMDQFAIEQGFELDFSESRRHHELYLSDPRKTTPEKLKTILRHPVK